VETHLSGIDYFFLTIPIVFVLFVWVGAVFWANAHPGVRHSGGVSDRAVGASGGREALSGQGGLPAESTLATGAADENTGDAAAGGQYGPAAPEAPAPARAAPDQAVPDQARADQARADQARADQARADQARADQARADRREPDDTAPDHPAL
jgi:hypothetical protein